MDGIQQCSGASLYSRLSWGSSLSGTLIYRPLANNLYIRKLLRIVYCFVSGGLQDDLFVKQITFQAMGLYATLKDFELDAYFLKCILTQNGRMQFHLSFKPSQENRAHVLWCRRHLDPRFDMVCSILCICLYCCVL